MQYANLLMIDSGLVKTTDQTTIENAIRQAEASINKQLRLVKLLKLLLAEAKSR